MLEIKNLNASFAHSGHFRLKNIALSIALKERVALVGESGSGKSMLAQMILNLQPNIAIQSGEICFNGKNVLSLSPSKCASCVEMRLPIFHKNRFQASILSKR